MVEKTGGWVLHEWSNKRQSEYKYSDFANVVDVNQILTTAMISYIRGNISFKSLKRERKHQLRFLNDLNWYLRSKWHVCKNLYCLSKKTLYTCLSKKTLWTFLQFLSCMFCLSFFGLQLGYLSPFSWYLPHNGPQRLVYPSNQFWDLRVSGVCILS